MTTTETPSVDEARRAYESAVEHALDNMDKEDGRHDEAECRAFRDAAFARLAAAVRAEAIRERDEAVALLRWLHVTNFYADRCMYCERVSGHEEVCVFAPLPDFLARFPEAAG